MSLLKQTLRDKWVELQALTEEEKRLNRGNLNDSCMYPSTDSLASLMSPTGVHGHRFSSDSSWRSVMTEGSDQASVFGDLNSPSPCSAASTTDDSCFFPSTDVHQGVAPSLSSAGSTGPGISRARSCSLAGSSSSLSPPWEGSARATSIFGTLPRKSRRGSVRQHLLKFLPGLNRSVEEEVDT